MIRRYYPFWLGLILCIILTGICVKYQFMIMVIMVILFLGATAFISNSIAALMFVKQEKISVFWNSYLLLFGGFCNIIIIMVFMLLLTDRQNNKQPTPKYELITTPVYKQI